MKKVILSFCLCIALGIGSANGVDLDVGGMWLFDEDGGDVTKDSSENGNDGAVLGGVEWIAEGKFGGALSFDGTDGSVEVPDNDSVEFPQGVDFTLACWLMVTTPEGSPPMIVAKNYQPVQVLPWYALYYADQAKAATGNMSIFLRDVDAASFHVAGISKVDDGEWHHIAGIREGDVMYLYINGVEEATLDGVDFDVGTNDAPLHFMSHTGRFMGGALDEVLILRQAMSAAEVNNLMNDGAESLLAVSSAGKLPTTWAKLKSN